MSGLSVQLRSRWNELRLLLLGGKLIGVKVEWNNKKIWWEPVRPIPAEQWMTIGDISKASSSGGVGGS